MKCNTLTQLNDLVSTGKIRELVRENEALHEKCFSQIADMIYNKGARIIMIAGPSASGKTTSANRLATQLGVLCKRTMLVSLDDYYYDRDKILPGADGKLDLEHINTIDIALFNDHMKMLVAGEAVRLPSFNFKSGKREWHDGFRRLDSNSVVIVEGIHALNPEVLSADFNKQIVFKLYVCPSISIEIDNENIVSSSTLRLLRRMVRDQKSRGTSILHTMAMWASVCSGEERWIAPFRESADILFNSATFYELSVLKRHIYQDLTQILPENEHYDEIMRLVELLEPVLVADVENEIPPTSIVREFIGECSFYK